VQVQYTLGDGQWHKSLFLSLLSLRNNCGKEVMKHCLPITIKLPHQDLSGNRCTCSRKGRSVARVYNYVSNCGVRGAPVGLTVHRPSTRLYAGLFYLILNHNPFLIINELFERNEPFLKITVSPLLAIPQYLSFRNILLSYS
jgi:hypothetical protein